MACWEYLGVAKIAIFLRFFGFSRRFFSFGWWRLLDRNVLRELLCKGVSPVVVRARLSCLISCVPSTQVLQDFISDIYRGIFTEKNSCGTLSLLSFFPLG